MSERTYTVYRSEFSYGKGATRRVLHTGKLLDEARELQKSGEEALRREPGYRENVMSRPLICIELEKPKGEVKC